METEEEGETVHVKELSDECDNEHMDQLNDDNGNDIPEWAYSDNPSTVPITDCHSTLPIPVTTAETTPANVIETDAPNHHPKQVIKLGVQADQVMIDDSDCANPDCDDPKRPSKLVRCVSLGC